MDITAFRNVYIYILNRRKEESFIVEPQRFSDVINDFLGYNWTGTAIKKSS